MPETDTVHLMTGNWARAVSLAVGCAAIAGACSGSDQPAVEPSLESAEPISAPPSTDAPAPTTTVVVDPVTSATTTSTSTPPTTSTTPAPPTTTLEDLRLEIEADLNEGEQAFLSSGADPGANTSAAAVAVYFAGRSLDSVIRIYQDLVADGAAIRRGATASTHHVQELIIVAGDTATIRNCRIDGAITYRTGPPEVELDADVVRYNSLNEVLLSDGIWKLNGGDTLTREIGPQTCDD